METQTSVFSSAVLTSLIVSALTAAFKDHQEVKVHPGQEVTLQCHSPDGPIRLLQWSRPDLKSAGFVFFYRNQRPVESFQHPYFRHRVQLRDPEMQDGNMSVVLKDVNINDTGTYECRVSVDSKGLRKRSAPETMNTVVLKVLDSGLTAGNTDGGKHQHIGAALSVSGLIVLLVVVVMWKKTKRHRKKNSDPPDL